MRLAPFAALALSLPLPAIADACRDEIAALYAGGALDPFAQPAYSYDTTVTAADGTVKYEFHTVFDTPLRSMSGLKGQMVTLSIGSRTWIAPGPDGPWTEAPNQNPDDMEAFHKANRDQLARNIRDAACPGETALDGQRYLTYRFTTQTDPDPATGAYFGSTKTVFIDPATGRLMRIEDTGGFAHYAPDPGTDVTTSVYTYDPAISLSAPD